MRLTNPLDFLNHFMFAGVLLWFVLQHSALNIAPIKYGPADVTKAFYYQPRTPPPVLDPEQIDTSLEDIDYSPYGFAIKPFGQW